MKLHINFFTSTSSNAYGKEPIAKSTQTPVHGSPLLPNNQEKKTPSSARQDHAAFLANSTMQWKIGAAFRKTSVTPPAQDGKNDQDIASALHAAAKDNNAEGIHDFAFSQLENIPSNQRLAWLRKLGADKAMSESMKQGSVETIEAWGEVVKLLPEGSRFAFLNDKNGDHDSIATGIFSNTQPGTMKAWGKVLELVPDQNQERSKLLFSRMDHEADTPALALLFERGEKQALDQFVNLAKQHVWHGNEDIHHVLSDCMPALKLLTSTRGNVNGKEAQDWVTAEGLKYTKPHGLSSRAEDIAKAFGKLVQLAPEKYRNDLLFPEDIWTVPKIVGRKEGIHRSLSKDLDPHQVQELAQSLTHLHAMAGAITIKDRKAAEKRKATKKQERKEIVQEYGKLAKMMPKKFQNRTLFPKSHNATVSSITAEKLEAAEENEAAQARKEFLEAYKKLEQLLSEKLQNEVLFPEDTQAVGKADIHQAPELAQTIAKLNTILPTLTEGERKEIATAYAKLMPLVPQKYQSDVADPKNIWTTPKTHREEGHHSALTNQLSPYQARELAHSITLLKAMVPTMTAEERKAVLNEIRSRHATKVMGVWKNTHSYEKFKKEYPAVDAMLLDLKAELKKA